MHPFHYSGTHYRTCCIYMFKALPKWDRWVIWNYITSDNIKFVTRNEFLLAQFYRKVFTANNNNLRICNERFEHFANKFSCRVLDNAVARQNWSQLDRFLMNFGYSIKVWNIMPPAHCNNLEA